MDGGIDPTTVDDAERPPPAEDPQAKTEAKADPQAKGADDEEEDAFVEHLKAEEGEGEGGSGGVERPAEVQDRASRFPIRETSFFLPLPGGGGKQKLRFNWLVSLVGLGVLWGLSIFCMTSPDEAKANLSEWYDTTILYFTWFYIVGSPFMTFFIFWIAYRYGHIKLGPKDAEPEFSNVSYFFMLFSAGIGVAIFFFGVSEPLYHQSGNWYTAQGYRSQNEIDQWALNITMNGWGFAGWSPYLVMAISAGLASYCFGLPLTVRSSFYPMLGDYTWGWIGDLIDGLGLGTIQLTVGMTRLGWINPVSEQDKVKVYAAIIWIITIAATISVVTGLKLGIKVLSTIGFGLGSLILFLCFVMEKSYFLLNLLVQTTGVYLQWNIFQLPFWTDAFGALREGEGRAVDGNSADPQWMGWWTAFYMAWWVAWACFVGLFIARISKNRTLRSVIIGVFLAPVAYSLLWFSFIGGIGLRQQRQALELEKLGNASFANPEYFQTSDSTFCYDVPQNDVYVNNTLVFSNTLPGITPVCKFDWQNAEGSWFNVMYSFSYPGTGSDGNFPGFGPFLSGLTIFTLAIYFITSSDSGSLIVDTLASNGSEEHHWLQRVFWALTEGAVATGLLVAGGRDALVAIRTASIVFGYMCWGITKMCETLEKFAGNGLLDPKLLLPKKTWQMPLFGGVFNVMEYIFSFGRINEDLGVDFPTGYQALGFLKNLLAPFLSVFSIHTLLGKNTLSRALLTGAYLICHLYWISLFA
ncbi:hypothetical protein ACHAWF_014345 [Thalassiosira exigua]